MTLSSVATTFLHAHQLISDRHGINNSMDRSFSFGMSTKFTKLSTSIAVKRFTSSTERMTSDARKGLQVRMLKGAGVGQPPEVVGFGLQRTGGKAKHKLLTLDLAKVKEVQKYELFARKFVEGEPASKWESIGDILLEKGSNLEMALKERRKKLLAAAQYQHPLFLMLNAGEELRYGFRKAEEETDDNDIVLVDVKGKDPDSSIPALLRADDGVKPPPKRY